MVRRTKNAVGGWLGLTRATMIASRESATAWFRDKKEKATDRTGPSPKVNWGRFTVIVVTSLIAEVTTDDSAR